MWRRLGLSVQSNTVELPWSLLRFLPVMSSLLGFCWLDGLSKQRRGLNLAQSQKIHEEERVFGKGMLLPFLFLFLFSKSYPISMVFLLA